MKSLKPIHLLFLMALYLLPQFALAQEVNGASVAIKMADAVDQGLKSIGNSGKLLDIGLSFFGLFVVGGIAWQLVKGLATGRMLDAFLGDILPLGIAAVMAYAFMGQIPGVPSLVSAIQGLMSAIETALLGKATNSIGQTITYAVVAMTDAIISVTEIDVSAGAPASGLVETIRNIGTFTVAFIYKIMMVIAVTLGLLFATVMFIGTLVMTQIAFAIAMIFAPVFIPFMTFRPAAGFFNTWLSFSIISSITKILGLLVLDVSTVMLKSMVEIANTLPIPPEQGAVGLLQIDMIKYTALILLSGMIALLMLEVPKIAAGLVGSVSAGFSGWGSLNNGVTAKGPLGGFGSSKGGGWGNAGGSPPGGPPGNPPASGGRSGGGGLLTSVTPNMFKPVSRVADAGLSALAGAGVRAGQAHAGKRMAVRDREAIDAQKANFVGPGKGGGNIERDTSKMAPATRNAYISSLEQTNRQNASKGMDPYTVSAPVSSTVPAKKKP